MTLTLQTIPQFLAKHNIGVGQKVDPLVEMVKPIESVNAEKVGRLKEILSYSDEFVDLVSSKMQEPNIKEGYVNQVKDLREALSEARDFYKIKNAPGIAAKIKRIFHRMNVAVEGTVQQRFTKSWNGLENVLTGAVKDVSEEKEIKESFDAYMLLKEEAVVIATDLFNDYKVSQLKVAKDAFESANSSFEEGKTTLTPDSTELVKLRQNQEAMQKEYLQADDTYAHLDRIRTELGNSVVIGKGLSQRLGQMIKAESSVKNETATMLSSNREVFYMLMATYTAQESMSRAADAVDAAKNAQNEALSYITEVGDDALKRATIAANRPTYDAAKIEAFYQSIVGHEQWLASELPKLREARRENYRQAIQSRDKATAAISTAIASYNL